MKRVTTTRWSCRADATKALKHCYLHVKNGLEKICNDTEEKARVRCDAEGLLARLNQLETGRHIPRANGAKRRVRVLIPHGYLHPGNGKHSEV